MITGKALNELKTANPVRLKLNRIYSPVVRYERHVQKRDDKVKGFPGSYVVGDQGLHRDPNSVGNLGYAVSPAPPAGTRHLGHEQKTSYQASWDSSSIDITGVKPWVIQSFLTFDSMDRTLNCDHSLESC